MDEAKAKDMFPEAKSMRMLGAIGGEIAAWIAENCFSILDAPPMRCTSLDTPIPFSIELENNFMARARLD